MTVIVAKDNATAGLEHPPQAEVIPVEFHDLIDVAVWVDRSEVHMPRACLKGAEAVACMHKAVLFFLEAFDPFDFRGNKVFE